MVAKSKSDSMAPPTTSLAEICLSPGTPRSNCRWRKVTVTNFLMVSSWCYTSSATWIDATGWPLFCLDHLGKSESSEMSFGHYWKFMLGFVWKWRNTQCHTVIPIKMAILWFLHTRGVCQHLIFENDPASTEIGRSICIYIYRNAEEDRKVTSYNVGALDG